MSRAQVRSLGLLLCLLLLAVDSTGRIHWNGTACGPRSIEKPGKNQSASGPARAHQPDPDSGPGATSEPPDDLPPGNGVSKEVSRSEGSTSRGGDSRLEAGLAPRGSAVRERGSDTQSGTERGGNFQPGSTLEPLEKDELLEEDEPSEGEEPEKDEPESDEPPDSSFYRQRMTPDGVIPLRARDRALAAARLEEIADQARRAATGSERERRTPAASDLDTTLVGGTWVPAGPTNVPGRVTAIAVDPHDPLHVWLGAAAGGVWSSTDGGTNWTPVFDGQTCQSIGAIAVHPTDSQTLYVGTGEDNGAGYSYDGDGVFKTTNGGSTWTNLGLAEVRRIARIAIDPSDPERIFVAAGGGVFNRDGNRGVYRSTNGGATWQRVLFVAEDSGAIDVAIDPSHPSRIYAAFWTRYSTATELVFGGVNSGIWQSNDGGTNWSRLSNGLPAASSLVGRIGLAIAPSSPQVVYAIYRGPGDLMGIWKTTNSGASWSRIDNPSGNHVSRFSGYGFYFGQIIVDPANVNNVYALDISWYRSSDGGVSWQQRSGLHVDHHALVILPGGRWYMGNDGGFYTSLSSGNGWTQATNLPISQIYDLGIDKLNPLHRFVGLQDNGVQKTTTGGTSDWAEVLGNDGFQCEVDPTNSSRVYAENQYGSIFRSTNGGSSFSGATSGINAADRTSFNTPIAHDPTTGSRLYTGTYRMYRSVDGAASWAPISNDLSDGPHVDLEHRIPPPDSSSFPDDGPSMDGGLFQDSGTSPAETDDPTPDTLAEDDRVSRRLGDDGILPMRTDDRVPGPPQPPGPSRSRGRDHLSNAVEGTIVAIGVSPVSNSVVWAGTDDGNVWVSSNGGGSWTEVTPPGNTQWVTKIAADPFNAQTAYVTLSGYREGLYIPHIVKMTGFGATQTDITGNLPQMPLNAVVADPRMSGRLFVGSDVGVYVTENGGASWSAVGTGMPRVVVMDLALHDSTRKLFAGTYGRSMYTYDLTQLEAIDSDGDGVADSADCAPGDPGAFAVPVEISGQLFAGDKETQLWSAAAAGAGTGTIYDLVRGTLGELPVGSGPTETCVAHDLARTKASDEALPSEGTGFWYLARARNTCGPGSYGFSSSGSQRTSASCP